MAGTTDRPRRFPEDAPTVVDTLAPPPASETAVDPAASETGSGSSRAGSGSTSLITAKETLELQEIHRTRMFVRVAIFMAAIQALALAFVGGDRVAKGIFLCTLATTVAACVWIAWFLRQDAGYTTRRATIVAYATVLAASGGVWFYGVFSPAPVIIPFGVYFFSAGQDRRMTTAVYATCAGVYVLFAALLLSGAVTDHGLVHPVALTLVERVVIIVVVETIYLASFVVARSSREAMLYAIERHDVVVRGLAQRDALLKEARQDLVQALHVGGIGRYTGEVVGPYRLGKVIGRGAMGEVYEAARLDNRAEAAVKLLHPQLLAEPDLVERFFREAKIMGALHGANVVKILEAGPLDAQLPSLAMERLRGEDLADYLRTHKKMALRKVLTLLRQVGVGLDAARAAGIVHRDLKPRNLFLARLEGGGEVWKILDFGVSKMTAEEGTLTQGMIVGTPANMAPEQAQGEPVTHLSDIFAMGVITYRALTGTPPFSGDTPIEILFRVVHAMPDRPSELSSLPPQVDLVLAIALAKAPKDRFGSAAELAQALDAASHDRLDGALRQRAERLLDELPWGSRG